MKFRRQTLAHRATDAGSCVCRLTLAAQCCSVMARVSDAAMLERQTLTSASVASGVCSAASLGFNGRRAASVAEATDASVAFGRARGGSDRCSATSIGRPTDVSVAFERDTERTRPRLSVRQTCAREASDAFVAEEVDRWILVARRRGTRRSDGRYCAVSVAKPTDATVQRLSPPKNAQWVSNGSISLWSYK
jgi:hypothetical protein